MPVLVGKYRTDIVPDLCLIDAQVCAHVLFEQQPLVCVIGLVPLGEAAQILLVASGKIAGIDLKVPCEGRRCCWESVHIFFFKTSANSFE